MKVLVHEPDPMEAVTSFSPQGEGGAIITVEPAFYGKARNALALVLSTTTNKGKLLGYYRLKVTDNGKLTLEDLGERRKLDIDSS